MVSDRLSVVFEERLTYLGFNLLQQLTCRLIVRVLRHQLPLHRQCQNQFAQFLNAVQGSKGKVKVAF